MVCFTGCQAFEPTVSVCCATLCATLCALSENSDLQEDASQRKRELARECGQRRRETPSAGFKTRDAAEHYRARLLEREALQSPAALSDLTTLAAASVRLALERLEPYEASLLDAVDYFIKFAKPPKGKVTIQEAMDSFERDNRRRDLSEAFLTRSRAFFSRFRDAFGIA